jgi:hypothetical protein
LVEGVIRFWEAVVLGADIDDFPHLGIDDAGAEGVGVIWRFPKARAAAWVRAPTEDLLAE